ncbi:MAG TPA: hypothetical protein VKG44_00350, partial [Candidatus Baltobacteraceae bacterium]|nr:hypothetical protein [Candidatus Baltobacteraceae bacterium]
MISVLDFEPAHGDGSAIRRARFVTRSTLPLSAASVVANGVRETLARLLARECEVELIEPLVLNRAERETLLAGAHVERVRGRRGDAFVIVRPADARRLAALAFGELERDAAPLSAIERETLGRISASLVPLCTALCGTLGPVTRETPEDALTALASYFEVRTTFAPRVAIGFGLSLDPPEEIGAQVELADLADVELSGRVEFAVGALAVPAFARLRPGAMLAFDSALEAPALLRLGGVPFARGAAGVR